MNRIRKRRFIATLVILFVLGFIFFSIGYKKSEDVTYTYKENNSVDYKVFLKKNNYFDMPYLEKDKTYITSLIDYVDADFIYNINFNKNVSGELKYKFYAEIKADKNNNDVGNYWTKTYELGNEQTSSITSTNSHEIKVNQKIDYNKYNDLLNSFIKEYVKYYNIVSTNYYNIIANDVITTDPTSSISNIYGFKDNLVYSENFSKISKGFKLPYIFVAKSIPYYLYKGLNLQNTLQLINSGDLDTNFLINFVNAHTLEPIIKYGERYFMMTTSLDEVNDKNSEEHLYKEGSYYKLPEDGAKYFVDTFTNKKYKPGKKVKVENSMHFKAIN